jgi:hypothetical protein
MITVQLLDIVNAKEPLERLAKEKLPARTAYRLHKILRKVDQILRDFETARGELVRKFGSEDPEKQAWKVAPEKLAEFNGEYVELLQTEEALNLISLDPDELGSLAISAGDMLLMWFLFDDDQG